MARNQTPVNPWGGFTGTVDTAASGWTTPLQNPYGNIQGTGAPRQGTLLPPGRNPLDAGYQGGGRSAPGGPAPSGSPNPLPYAPTPQSNPYNAQGNPAYDMVAPGHPRSPFTTPGTIPGTVDVLGLKPKMGNPGMLQNAPDAYTPWRMPGMTFQDAFNGNYHGTSYAAWGNPWQGNNWVGFNTNPTQAYGGWTPQMATGYVPQPTPLPPSGGRGIESQSFLNPGSYLEIHQYANNGQAGGEPPGAYGYNGPPVQQPPGLFNNPQGPFESQGGGYHPMPLPTGPANAAPMMAGAGRGASPLGRLDLTQAKAGGLAPGYQGAGQDLDLQRKMLLERGGYRGGWQDADQIAQKLNAYLGIGTGPGSLGTDPSRGRGTIPPGQGSQLGALGQRVSQYLSQLQGQSGSGNPGGMWALGGMGGGNQFGIPQGSFGEPPGAYGYSGPMFGAGPLDALRWTAPGELESQTGVGNSSPYTNGLPQVDQYGNPYAPMTGMGGNLAGSPFTGPGPWGIAGGVDDSFQALLAQLASQNGGNTGGSAGSPYNPSGQYADRDPFPEIFGNSPGLMNTLGGLLGGQSGLNDYLSQATQGLKANYQNELQDAITALRSQFAASGNFLSSPMFAAEGELRSDMGAKYLSDLASMQLQTAESERGRQFQTANQMAQLYADYARQAQASGASVEAARLGALASQYGSQAQYLASIYGSQAGLMGNMYNTDANIYGNQLNFLSNLYNTNADYNASIFGTQGNMYGNQLGLYGSMYGNNLNYLSNLYNTQAGMYGNNLDFLSRIYGTQGNMYGNQLDYLLGQQSLGSNNALQLLQLQANQQGVSFQQAMQLATLAQQGDQNALSMLMQAYNMPADRVMGLMQILAGIQNVQNNTGGGLLGEGGIGNLIGGIGGGLGGIFGSAAGGSSAASGIGSAATALWAWL